METKRQTERQRERDRKEEKQTDRQTSLPDNCVVSVFHSISERGLSAYTTQLLGVRLRVFIAFRNASCIVTPSLMGTWGEERKNKRLKG